MIYLIYKVLKEHTVSMTTERPHPVGSFWPRPLDVPQNQRPDREARLVGETTRVLCPVIGERGEKKWRIRVRQMKMRKKKNESENKRQVNKMKNVQFKKRRRGLNINMKWKKQLKEKQTTSSSFDRILIRLIYLHKIWQETATREQPFGL